MGGPKGGKGGGKGGKGQPKTVWTGSTGGAAGGGYGGPCRPQEVEALLQQRLPHHEAANVCRRIKGMNVGKMPGSGGAQGAQAWAQVARAWQLLGCAAAEQPIPEETEDLHAQLLRLTGSDWFAKADPWQVEREFQRSNKYAHYLFLALHPELPKQRVQQQSFAEGDDLPKVLMVAEKPKMVEAIAGNLSGNRMRWRKGIAKGLPIYEFIQYFPPAGQKCKFIMTCTTGHMFGLDIHPDDNQTAGNDPSQLYSARVVKVVEETTAKMRIVENLQDLASECEYLVLWLDCDREGENIGFEVIGVCRDQFPNDDNIYRAQFSALTEQEMKRALNTLVRPNKYLSMSVDARQELDLKIGFSFSRMLRRNLLDLAKAKFHKDPPTTISYGPCQIPTLWFCCVRHNEIQNFQRQDYWTPKLRAELPGLGQCEFEWSEGRTFDQQQAFSVEQLCRAAGQASVLGVTSEQKTVRRPAGLNTVQMLKAASSGMGMSPVACMKAAEVLYTCGYISYPRTESSRYPPSFDVAGALREQSHHPNWGRTAGYILAHNPNIRPPMQGHDAGDHPPITPVRCAPRGEIAKGKEWKLYDYIARHFIASLMDDVQYTEHTLTVSVGQHVTFKYKWHTIEEPGFWFAMPWKQKDQNLNEVQRAPSVGHGVRLRLTGVTNEQDYTRPPDYLKESELVELMDTHGIGTDASIPTHVQNIIDRKYAQVRGPGSDGQPGNRILTEQEIYDRRWAKRGGDPNFQPERPTSRHMVPTGLGLAMIAGFERIDRELCEPTLRAFMERQVGMIADGSESLQDVLSQNLTLFNNKFLNFRDNMGQLEEFFRPKFSGGSYRDFGANRGGGQDGGWQGDGADWLDDSGGVWREGHGGGGGRGGKGRRGGGGRGGGGRKGGGGRGGGAGKGGGRRGGGKGWS
mmetsp:Transcript_162017/g.519455  ORF Transcript_162017/g.519455 Transcript_162017/m.519455 type:complete len:912 (+) Transcript_162017:19-2754(+)